MSAVDFYFIEEDGKRFKATMSFEPYFYIRVKKVGGAGLRRRRGNGGWDERGKLIS